MRVRIGPGVALFEWLWCALHDAKVKDLAVAHQDYGGLVKADWRKIPITLIDLNFGEGKAQACVNA